ncbi:porin [Noviherbaspirillum saxi]|uniref:Porin n=1 Tax=Noviherbaspirillum saxi TaxID=2320863 RepID=A0A3A3FYL3_9BURK|nr:porin [Noviherbaspirillum saxi]RJF92179.1 porin [Noviherbaspirillum saxi]
MKKTLLALAVLGAISGSAAAQTNVTVYGLMDLGYVRESGSPAVGSVNKLTSGIANGSRVGFRGTEDLGGGLSALFTIESGFQADTGVMGQGGLLFGRQAFVGLQGGFGSVKLGRQYTPIDVTLGAIDPFGNGLTAKTVNLFARGYVSRFDNGILYTTPKFGGFQADLGYGFGEVAGNNSAGRYLGGSVSYAAGPINVRLAYQDTNTRPTAAGVTPAVLAGSDQNLVLGATYNFGVATLHAAYGRTEADRGVTTTAEFDDAMIGVTVPVGAGRFLANYVRRNDDLATNDANFYGIGYMHALSKRTTLYTSFGKMSGKGPVSRTYTVGSSIEGGTGNKGLAIGVRHTF